MDIFVLRPWQLRSIDAGPQELLGVANPMDRAGELLSEFDDILGHPIGQGALGLGPNKFIRVEFWGVGWEELDMKSPVLE